MTDRAPLPVETTDYEKYKEASNALIRKFRAAGISGLEVRLDSKSCASAADAIEAVRDVSVAAIYDAAENRLITKFWRTIFSVSVTIAFCVGVVVGSLL